MLIKEAASPKVTDDEEATQRKVLPFVWGSSLFQNKKCNLDREYDESLKILSKRLKAKVIRSRTEMTMAPQPRNIQVWAISSTYQ